MTATRGRRAGIAALLLVAGACGRGAPEREGAAAGARGAPPETQATPQSLPDSHPSAARDTTVAPPTVVAHQVNTGPHGMAAQVRWLLSADQRAIIVVEDPVSVEAEPVPDGFLFANEATGVVLQVNGVWDVAPSPDWTRLAYGRAFVFRSGESDTIPSAEWNRLFAWLPDDVAAPSVAAMRRRVEPYTFPASGMSHARAIGIATIVNVGGRPPGRVAAIAGPAVRLEGWRVRWTPSGDTLAVGSAPATVQDDSDATRWTLVRARGIRSYRDSLGVAPPRLRMVDRPWVVGPTIDVSIDVDMDAERRVTTLGAIVRSGQKRIRVERGGTTTEVGPGLALAATRDARFIAALVPDREAGEFDQKARVVVYEVRP